MMKCVIVVICPQSPKLQPVKGILTYIWLLPHVALLPKSHDTF